MNDVLSFMIYGLAVIGGASPLDPGIEGVWVKEAASLSACGGSSGNSLIVTLHDFTLGETQCGFGGVLPEGVQAVGGKMDCSGLGETFRSEVRPMHKPGPKGRPTDERTYVSFHRTRPSGYRRCPD